MEISSKEKAKELFNKYFSEIRMPTDCEGCMQCVDRCGNMVAIAKQYAKIAVDEILKALKYPPKANINRQIIHIETINYWEEVKQEIEKL
jgi:ferredoxin